MIGLTDLLIKKRCASDWWMATARIGDHRAEALNFKLSARKLLMFLRIKKKNGLKENAVSMIISLVSILTADTLVLCRLGGYFPMIPPTTCRKLSDNLRQVVIELWNIFSRVQKFKLKVITIVSIHLSEIFFLNFFFFISFSVNNHFDLYLISKYFLVSLCLTLTVVMKKKTNKTHTLIKF